MRFHLLLLLILPAWLPLSGQNLVPNPGFENAFSCPKLKGQFSKCKDWSNAGVNPADYFHDWNNQNQGEAGVPFNYAGSRFPKNGEAYAGIHGPEKMPVITTHLTAPMKPGVTYCVRIWVNAPEPAKDANRLVGVWVSDSAFSKNTNGNINLPQESSVVFEQWIGDATQGWILQYGQYTARGGEDELYIGYTRKPTYECTTFIDEILVGEMPDDQQCSDPAVSLETEPEEMNGNLVHNPGFEIEFAYPEQRHDFNLLRWWKASENTPDFYHRKASSRTFAETATAGVPENFLGVQEAHEGDAYSGLWLCLPSFGYYRETLRGNFREPLKKDSTYYLGMWISQAEYSQKAANVLHAVITDKVLPEHFQLTDTDPHVVTLAHTPTAADKKNWIQVCATFKATGGEKFIYIKNLASDHPDNYPQTSKKLDAQLLREKADAGVNLEDGSYYYLDDISLYAKGDDRCPCQKKETAFVPPAGEKWEKGKVILRNLQFDVNESNLQPSSVPFLDSLGTYLRNNPGINIKLTGHTDATGGADRNLELSLERARSCAAHLQKTGIEARRIQTDGKGSTQPLRPENTPADRAINRRVEIVFE